VRAGGECLHGGGDALAVLARLLRVGTLVLEGGDVRSCGKGLVARATDHHAAQGSVLAELPGVRAELLPHRQRQRVQPLGAGQGQRGDFALAGEQDLAAHR
jgi:hypothetical protein